MLSLLRKGITSWANWKKIEELVERENSPSCLAQPVQAKAQPAETKPQRVKGWVFSVEV